MFNPTRTLSFRRKAYACSSTINESFISIGEGKEANAHMFIQKERSMFIQKGRSMFTQMRIYIRIYTKSCFSHCRPASIFNFIMIVHLIVQFIHLLVRLRI